MESWEAEKEAFIQAAKFGCVVRVYTAVEATMVATRHYEARHGREVR